MLFKEELFKGVEMTEHLRLYHTTNEKYKGIIFNQSHELVVSNFPIPEELVVEPGVDVNLEFPLKVYKSVEGTLIRVFYYDDEWHLATSSRLDAYTSFWSNQKSFGKQFEEYVESISGTPLDVFLCSLDRSMAYFFLLPTSGVNRIGKSKDDTKKCIYLVGFQKNGKLELADSESVQPNLWSYLDFAIVNEVEELLELIQDNPVIHYSSELDKIHKYTSRDYSERCKLRNNSQSVVGRYFELLRQDSEQATKFRSMYPEANLEFYSKQLNTIAGYIHKNYYNRYVKKEYTVVPKIYFEIMKKCHQRYLETHEKTTGVQVYNIILEQDTKVILSLIRNFSY
jgi:hypothetical protein